jgi:hypothetical protein
MAVTMMVAVSVMMTVAAVVPVAPGAVERGSNTQREMALLHEWTGRSTGAISHMKAAVEGLCGADGW